MGSTSSKFKKYMYTGDEYAAMHMYQASFELRKNLDPNASYGDHHNHNTALHYAAKHGMKHLLRAFLNDLGGNPNKKNALNETALHCACQQNPTKSFGIHERRAICVQLLLYWKGVTLTEGGREKVDLSAQDKDGNTALHWAASTGLKRCVELLLAHGAPLYVENNDKLTPCDLAMKGSYHEIARLLESRMVFADNNDIINEDDILQDREEVYSGLRSQDLQEAKDQLLVDTSDMLKVPLFTAEALLRDNEWSREMLLEKWIKDPIDCCVSAGVQAPASLKTFGGSLDSSASTDQSDDNEATCEICLSSIPHKDHSTKMSCKHYFCRTCWERYLTTKIQEGNAHHILCPAFQCHILVPVDFIEKLVSPDMARRYLQFDIKAFVESNKSIKWCPVAGCGRAVRFPETEQGVKIFKKKSIPVTSHAVDCGNSHFFCWECLGEAHAPSGCSQWQEWKLKIAEVKPEELKASCSGSEDAANFLWLVTNSKPCPNCKSPIQKNEGCNHIKCSKCKFDFCWVCQESWKKHSSATGGYFRCNRYESVNKADEKQGTLISEALDKNNQLQEMSRFLHFYTRFKNHENSRKLEEPLLITVKQKMEILAYTLGMRVGKHSQEKNTKFIEDGVRELLKARRVLCGSYVYGFYLVDDGYNKSIFEFMQNELEEVTEKLSEMIARAYLRTPKSVIVQTTALTRRKRHEFVKAVAQGLIPPETPPYQRRRLSKSVDGSYKETTALLMECEWPDYDSDEEIQMSHKNISKTRSETPKAKEHQCGFLCTSAYCLNSDFNMEMIIALEMSRLQMIEDRMKQAQTVNFMDNSSNSIAEDSVCDDQLNLAIQLSLQETSNQNLLPSISKIESDSEGKYQKTNADFTVDYFLKSLANRTIDLKSLQLDKFKNDSGLSFRSCNGKEDGRFQISDIHENGFAFADSDDYVEQNYFLKRSHSTGDLCKRSWTGSRIRRNGEEPRYHLDSDHSSQHDEKPEELSKRMLAQSTSSSKTKHVMLLQQTYTEEDSYQGQSSVEDTTISDSINADLEVCGILNSGDGVEANNKTCLYDTKNLKKKTDSKTLKIEPGKKHMHQNAFSSIKAKICAAHLPKSTYLSRFAVNKNIGLLNAKCKDNFSTNKNNKIFGECQSEKQSPKNRALKKTNQDINVSKSTGYLAEEKRKTFKNNSILKIKISKEPEKPQQLETDSSNEYESETGIPKSPTLFISGVSISRTPEPKSPAISLLVNNGGRQSRSSSLSIPAAPLASCSLSISNSSLNNFQEPFNPLLIQSTTPASSRSNLESSFSPVSSPSRSGKEASKSKSANEPEREREMFRFPKSSTDGALSSVLHVQESNLSSDDFHEALFLLERSPKTRDSKRRKKSKKKDKDDKSKEDISSAL